MNAFIVAALTASIVEAHKLGDPPSRRPWLRYPGHLWVCGSHIVILQGGDIIDPARGDRMPALEHRGMEKFTKRIFRVVPANHPRGL